MWFGLQEVIKQPSVSLEFDKATDRNGLPQANVILTSSNRNFYWRKLEFGSTTKTVEVIQEKLKSIFDELLQLNIRLYAMETDNEMSMQALREKLDEDVTFSPVWLDWI